MRTYTIQRTRVYYIDGLRVINRIIQTAKEAGFVVEKITGNTTCQAKRRLFEIVKYVHKRTEEKYDLIKGSCRRLIALAKQVVKNAAKVKNNIIRKTSEKTTIETEALIAHLIEKKETMVSPSSKMLCRQ